MVLKNLTILIFFYEKWVDKIIFKDGEVSFFLDVWVNFQELLSMINLKDLGGGVLMEESVEGDGGVFHERIIRSLCRV